MHRPEGVVLPGPLAQAPEKRIAYGDMQGQRTTKPIHTAPDADFWTSLLLPKPEFQFTLINHARPSAPIRDGGLGARTFLSGVVAANANQLGSGFHQPGAISGHGFLKVSTRKLISHSLHSEALS